MYQKRVNLLLALMIFSQFNCLGVHYTLINKDDCENNTLLIAYAPERQLVIESNSYPRKIVKPVSRKKFDDTFEGYSFYGPIEPGEYKITGFRAYGVYSFLEKNSFIHFTVTPGQKVLHVGIFNFKTPVKSWQGPFTIREVEEKDINNAKNILNKYFPNSGWIDKNILWCNAYEYDKQLPVVENSFPPTRNCKILKIFNDSIYIDEEMVGLTSTLNNIKDSISNPIYTPLEKYLINSDIDSNSTVRFHLHKETSFKTIFILMNTCKTHKIDGIEIEVINKKSNKTGVLKTSFPDFKRKRSTYLTKSDTLFLTAIVEDTVIKLGVKGGFLPNVVLTGPKQTKRDLTERFLGIKKRFANSPDINSVIIAASNNIKFDKIAMVFDCALSAGFKNFTLVKVRYARDL